jgi:hypothetical protein
LQIRLTEKAVLVVRFGVVIYREDLSPKRAA